MASSSIEKYPAHPSNQFPEMLLFPYKRLTEDEIENPVKPLIVNDRHITLSGFPVLVLRDPFFYDLKPETFYVFGTRILFCRQTSTGTILDDISMIPLDRR